MSTVLTASLRKKIAELESQLEALREDGRFDSAEHRYLAPKRDELANRLAGLRATLANVEHSEWIRATLKEALQEPYAEPHRYDQPTAQTPMAEWPRPFTFKDSEASDWTFPPERQHFTPEREPSRWWVFAAIMLVVSSAVFMLLQCTGTLQR